MNLMNLETNDYSPQFFTENSIAVKGDELVYAPAESGDAAGRKVSRSVPSANRALVEMVQKKTHELIQAGEQILASSSRKEGKLEKPSKLELNALQNRVDHLRKNMAAMVEAGVIDGGDWIGELNAEHEKIQLQLHPTVKVRFSGGEELTVDVKTLTKNSDYFRGLLKSSFRKSDEGLMNLEVPLPVFQKMLEFVEKNKVEEADFQALVDDLMFADGIGVPEYRKAIIFKLTKVFPEVLPEILIEYPLALYASIAEDHILQKEFITVLANAISAEKDPKKKEKFEEALVEMINHCSIQLNYSEPKKILNKILAASDAVKSKFEYLEFGKLDPKDLKLDDEVFAFYVRSFPNLKHIGVHDQAITGKGFSALNQLHKLESVNISGCKGLQDDDLTALSQLPVKKVNFMDCRFTDAGIEKIKNCPLEEVNLSYCPISDTSLTYLSDKPVKTALFASCRLSNAGLKAIAKCPVEHVNFSSSSVDDEGLSSIQGWKLKRAIFNNCDYITDAGLKVFETMPIEFALFRGSRGVSDQAARELRRYPVTF